METRLTTIARHPLARPLMALCVIWVALYFPLLTGTRVLPWDAIDQFYPTVWFNAHDVPIRRVNGMFRAVHVPEGEHELTFAFSPLRLIKTLFGYQPRLHQHPA